MGSAFWVLLLLSELSSFSPAEARLDEDLSSVSTDQITVQQEIVNKHNELRKAVSPSASNMLKMKWSPEATANAQKWAEQCKYGHSSAQFRRTNLSCGENLFMSSYLSTWSNAIQNWYDEYKDFNFGVGPKRSQAVVGHYTQVVWYASYLVGCGVAYCPQQSLKYFMVCQYCPAGNVYPRQYTPYNEGQPCSLCPNNCEDGLCTNSCGYEDLYSNCKELKQSVTCQHPLVNSGCKATCNCSNKIYNSPITRN